MIQSQSRRRAIGRTPALAIQTAASTTIKTLLAVCRSHPMCVDQPKVSYTSNTASPKSTFRGGGDLLPWINIHANTQIPEHCTTTACCSGNPHPYLRYSKLKLSSKPPDEKQNPRQCANVALNETVERWCRAALPCSYCMQTCSACHHLLRKRNGRLKAICQSTPIQSGTKRNPQPNDFFQRIQKVILAVKAEEGCRYETFLPPVIISCIANQNIYLHGQHKLPCRVDSLLSLSNLLSICMTSGNVDIHSGQMSQFPLNKAPTKSRTPCSDISIKSQSNCNLSNKVTAHLLQRRHVSGQLKHILGRRTSYAVSSVNGIRCNNSAIESKASVLCFNSPCSSGRKMFEFFNGHEYFRAKGGFQPTRYAHSLHGMDDFSDHHACMTTHFDQLQYGTPSESAVVSLLDKSSTLKWLQSDSLSLAQSMRSSYQVMQEITRLVEETLADGSYITEINACHMIHLLGQAGRGRLAWKVWQAILANSRHEIHPELFAVAIRACAMSSMQREAEDVFAQALIQIRKDFAANSSAQPTVPSSTIATASEFCRSTTSSSQQSQTYSFSSYGAVFAAAQFVAAMQGNVKGAYSVVRTMISQYHLPPTRAHRLQLLFAHARAGDLVGAQACFNDILTNHSRQDDQAYRYMLEAHAQVGDVDGAERIFSEMEHACQTFDGRAVTSLVKAYTRSNNADGALLVLSRFLTEYHITPPIKAFTIVMRVFADRGDVSGVESTMRLMKQSRQHLDTASFEFLIHAYVNNGQFTEAMEIYKRVFWQSDHHRPTFLLHKVLLSHFVDMKDLTSASILLLRCQIHGHNPSRMLSKAGLASVTEHATNVLMNFGHEHINSPFEHANWLNSSSHNIPRNPPERLQNSHSNAIKNTAEHEKPISTSLNTVNYKEQAENRWNIVDENPQEYTVEDSMSPYFEHSSTNHLCNRSESISALRNHAWYLQRNETIINRTQSTQRVGAKNPRTWCKYCQKFVLTIPLPFLQNLRETPSS